MRRIVSSPVEDHELPLPAETLDKQVVAGGAEDAEDGTPTSAHGGTPTA